MADMLPTTSKASSSQFSRFVVQSNDVLHGEARINVMKENSEEVVWFKERYLGEKEIIEHIVHNATRTICWTVHRPLHGWYIRLRAPTFPPGVFIPLTPVPPRSPHHVEAALSFHSRTSLPSQPDESLTYFASRPPPTRSSSSIHSYPPTPPLAPALVLQPPSPTSERPPQRNIQPSISEFVLAPYADAIPSKTLFARVLNAFRDYDKMNYYSFTLSRIAIQSPPPCSPSSPDAEFPPPQPPVSVSPSPSPALTSVKCLPLLTFHDQTSVLTVRSLTGLLEIDQEEEHLLGVDTSFWIAVALTYLDFLSDRGSYLAVLGD